jgi:FkbM family methyltransferase
MKYFFQKVLSHLKFLKQPHLYKYRKYGFDIEKYDDFRSLFFQSLNIRTILDIGANTGQLAVTLTNAFPNAQIYSFEPLPDCFEKLVEVSKNFSRINPINIALGEASGQIEFERNEYSASSSVLKIAKEHTDNFPFTEITKTVKVVMNTLDDFADELTLEENILVKLDVQGYESFVIAGGKKILSTAKIIITETSMEMLYENQKLFDDIYSTLTGLGFSYMGSFDQLLSPINGKVLQQDAIFLKNE